MAKAISAFTGDARTNGALEHRSPSAFGHAPKDHTSLAVEITQPGILLLQFSKWSCHLFAV